MHLLKNLEREMYWGNAHFANATSGAVTGHIGDIPSNSIAMNGLLQQLQKGDTDVLQRSGDFEGYGQVRSIGLNLAGNVIAQDDIEGQAVVALENFGAPRDLHIEPLVLSSFIKQFYPQFRSMPGLANQTVGYDVSAVTTSAGKIEFKPNLFLRPRSIARPKPVNANCPVAPTQAAPAAGSGSGSPLAAGTYQLKATQVNDFGESAPVQLTAVTITAGQNVTVQLNAGAAGAKYYKLYASNVGGAVGSELFVGNYSINTPTFVWSGFILPGLGEAFLLDLSPGCMKFKQLAPMSKINFAIVSTALEFAIVLYGALFVYTPRFNAFFRNCGK